MAPLFSYVPMACTYLRAHDRPKKFGLYVDRPQPGHLYQEKCRRVLELLLDRPPRQHEAQEFGSGIVSRNRTRWLENALQSTCHDGRPNGCGALAGFVERRVFPRLPLLEGCRGPG